MVFKSHQGARRCSGSWPIGPELVGDAGDEIRLDALELLQAVDHVVEGVGDVTQLVVRVDGQAQVIIFMTRLHC